jgi:NAD(P)-dependent dehydrogenase (short-subunit alcohol dehydrogenase family)
MPRVLITGSADGLGRQLLKPFWPKAMKLSCMLGHGKRHHALQDPLDRGASAVVGDLSHLE